MFFLMGKLCAQVSVQNSGALIGISDGIYMTVSGTYSQSDTADTKLNGVFRLGGNWVDDRIAGSQNSQATDSYGSIHLAGTEAQMIKGTNPSVLPNVVLNNTFGLRLGQDVEIVDTLIIQAGNIFAQDFELLLANTSADALQILDSNYYVIGELSRMVRAGGYVFPVGSLQNLQMATLILDDSISPQKVSLGFHTQGLTPPANLSIDGGRIIDFLDAGYWSLDSPDSIPSLFFLSLSSQGHSNGGDFSAQHSLLFRGDREWEPAATHQSSYISGNGQAKITASWPGLSQRGEYAIGVGEYPLSVPDPHQAYFSAFAAGKNRLKVVFESPSYQRVHLAIFTLSGQSIDQLTDFVQAGENAWTFDLSAWSGHAFFVYLLSEKGAYSAKIWK